MTRHPVFQNCTAISEACPVEYTIYGYYPSLGANAFFVAFFATFALLHLWYGYKAKVYFYAGAIIFGCMGEVTGYIGRILMHSNPYGSIGFKIQISCLIFSPSFIAAAVYITLKHLVLAFGQERSKIPARYYTWIFITCDFISLLLQAIGGGFAGGAKDDYTRSIGTNLMISGVVFQVATLLAFIALVSDYAFRTWRSWEKVSPEGHALLQQGKFKLFLLAITLAFLGIFIRCLYRIAEMVGGWANPIMRDEAGFIGAEGVMIVMAVLVMTIFHPGWTFPQMTGHYNIKSPVDSDNNMEMGSEGVEK